MTVTMLTGAGASKPFGYPTTLDFFDTTEMLDKYKQLFSYLIKYQHAPTLDVEDVLQLLQPIEDF